MDKYEENFIEYIQSVSDEELAGMAFRVVGTTTRLCDELVQKFFKAPYGEWVPVIDHYPSRQADRMLLDKFLRRMGNECPNIEVEVDKRRVCVRRKNKTYHELVMEELNRREDGKEL
jgi:hypothetical protein